MSLTLSANLLQYELLDVVLLSDGLTTSLRRLDSRTENPQEILDVSLSDLFPFGLTPVFLGTAQEIVRYKLLEAFCYKKLCGRHNLYLNLKFE